MSRLAGKVAIVTGGTRGIGLAIVKGFLREGARVVFSGTSAESVSRARDSLPAGDAHEGIAADLTNPANGDRLVERDSSAFNYLGFPMSEPAFAKKELRQAISMAIDRPAIIRAIFEDTKEPAASVVSPLVPGSRDDDELGVRADGVGGRMVVPAVLQAHHLGRRRVHAQKEEPAGREQRLVGPRLHHLAPLQHHDPIRISDRRRPDKTDSLLEPRRGDQRLSLRQRGFG